MAALLLSVSPAAAQPPPKPGGGATGTFVLVWKNPSPELEVSYGHGEYRGLRSPKLVWQSAGSAGIKPGAAQFQLPLPAGRGKFWYAFRDRARPSETYLALSGEYACPPGGRFRIEADASRRSHPPGSSPQYYVSLDTTKWLEGCTFPDNPLALTAPAVATITARWVNPSPAVDLMVLADRHEDILINKIQSASPRRLMQSGAGTLWFDVSDRSDEVWSVRSQAFHCADGGHLDVTVEASIVKDRPSLRVRYAGQGCQATGSPQQKCGSDRRRAGRTKSSEACFGHLPEPRCCVDAPNNPGEE